MNLRYQVDVVSDKAGWQVFFLKNKTQRVNRWVIFCTFVADTKMFAPHPLLASLEVIVFEYASGQLINCLLEGRRHTGEVRSQESEVRSRTGFISSFLSSVVYLQKLENCCIA